MNYNEADQKAREFIMNEKYKLHLSGDKIEREKFRQKRIYLIKKGILSPAFVIKAMKLMGYEISFKKDVEKLA